jgi:hypothetical protein
MIKTMAMNENVSSFVPSEWQDDDDFQLQLQPEDFANLFDDEPVAALSGGAIANKTFTEASCQSSTPRFFQDSQAVKPCDAIMDSINTPQCPSSSNSAPGQGFVNVYLIVDPVTQQVYCPKQLLVYNSGEKTQTAMFGPTFLNSFPKDTIESLANQVAQQSTTQLVAPDTNSSSFVNPIPTEPPSPTTVTQVMSYPDNISSLIGTSSKTVESEGQSDMPPATLAPLRALSPYNFFFRDERDRIVHGGPMELTPAKQHRLLQEHWGRDRTMRRRHRKTHGKIDFTSLSKLISKRWKELPEDRRAFYRQVAFLDWERYRAELREQKTSNTTPIVAPTHGQQ